MTNGCLIVLIDSDFSLFCAANAGGFRVCLLEIGLLFIPRTVFFFLILNLSFDRKETP